MSPFRTRIKSLGHPLAAVLRLREPIAFDAPDDEPVILLVFLFVPEMASEAHLEILSEIAEMLADRGLRERLKVETEPAAMHRTIAAWRPLGDESRPGLRKPSGSAAEQP